MLERPRDTVNQLLLARLVGGYKPQGRKPLKLEPGIVAARATPRPKRLWSRRDAGPLCEGTCCGDIGCLSAEGLAGPGPGRRHGTSDAANGWQPASPTHSPRTAEPERAGRKLPATGLELLLLANAAHLRPLGPPASA